MSFDTNNEKELIIVHLSDFHFNKESQLEIKVVLDALIKDQKKLKDEEGLKPDAIVISGDIGFSADQSDYNMASDWLSKLSDELEVPINRFYIIPGNHDVYRPELREFSKLEFIEESDVTKFLTKEKGERTEVFKKLDNFFEFTKNFYGEHNYYSDSYYLADNFDKNDLKIGVVGLNSVWYSGETKLQDGSIFDAKRLIIGEFQARTAFDKIGEVDLCLSILHHPFSYLVEFEEELIKKIVMNKSCLVFQGHLHSTQAIEQVEPDYRCLFLTAGASYIKGREKRYNMIKINLNDFTFVNYLRRYSEESKFWAKDTLTYLSGEGILEGRLQLSERETKEIIEKAYPFEKPNPTILEFIESKWKELLSSTEKEKLLELRKSYFHKTNINPQLHDISIHTIQYLLENKIVGTRSELESILGSPYFRLNLKKFETRNILNYFDEAYFDELNTEVVFKTGEQIAKLKEREFLIRIENQIGKKIKKELEEKYKEKENELEGMKKEIETEYKIFKSRIDDYADVTYSGMSKTKEPVVPQREILWYEELGLIKNPFPSHIGLEGFSEDEYDSIIVKTEIFHNFDKMIIKSEDSLYRRSFLIYGQMGSGKTTLFKYLQKTISILKPNCFTVLIPLEAQSSFENTRFDFYAKLSEKLIFKLFEINKSLSGFEKKLMNDSTISSLLNQIKSNSAYDHFIIFIDDLHKHPKYATEVFEFISGLQIFRSHMYESGIDVILFLSGDLSWISDTDGVKAIGGAIDIREKIPEITQDEAVEMINNRLKIFAKNPESPPTVKEDYIKTILKMLKSRFPIEITFRDVMEEVEKHWMRHEFESLQLSVILDFNTLSSMQLDIESDHPKIKEKIDKIWKDPDHDATVLDRFSDLLTKLYINTGISETDHEFEENIDYFGVLFNVGLMAKQRRGNSFVWILPKSVKKMFLKFENRYGFKPSEYLTKLYQTHEIDRRFETEESSRLNMILRTVRNYHPQFLNYVKDALENYLKIFQYSTSIDEIYSPNELIDLCNKSIAFLMKATLIVCENHIVQVESIQDLNEEFIDNWFENPDLTEFIDTLQKKELKESELDNNDAKQICRNYFRAVKTTVSNLQRFIKYDLIFPIYEKLIFIEDKKVLNLARKNLFSENFALALDKLNSLLKSKLVEFIYSYNCLFYGVNKWRRGLPVEINEKISESWIDAESKIILNEFKLNELIRVLLCDDVILVSMLNKLFGNGSWEQVRRTLFIEKDLQEVNSNSQVVRKKDEIVDYVVKSKLLINMIDSFYFKLFKNEIPFVLNFKEVGLFEKELGKAMTSYEIDDQIVKKIEAKIDSEGKLEIDLGRYIPHASFQELNFVDWVMYIYSMNYRLKKISINFGPNGRIFLT